jgi:hypothetical protein
VQQVQHLGPPEHFRRLGERVFVLRVAFGATVVPVQMRQVVVRLVLMFGLRCAGLGGLGYGVGFVLKLVQMLV